MEEKKKKKKKLTLTISSKKTYDAASYTQNTKKTSIVIDKSYSRKKNEKRSYIPNKSENRSRSGFINRKKPKKFNWHPVNKSSHGFVPSFTKRIITKIEKLY